MLRRVRIATLLSAWQTRQIVARSQAHVLYDLRPTSYDLAPEGDKVDRYAGEDDSEGHPRPNRVADQRIRHQVKDRRDEDRRHDGISGHAVGTRQVGARAPQA